MQPLKDQLNDEAYRFEFFEAVRLLQRLAVEDAPTDATPRHPVGGDHPPGQEVVRFRAMPSHSFPAGSIAELRPPSPNKSGDRPTGPPEMVTPFIGLTGPNGVLPQHYTSLMIERIRDKDFALRDFLDLFHHRIVALFYRAWEKYRFEINYERSASQETPTEDLFTHCLYCLVGLGTGGLRRRMEFDDEAVLYFAGHFAHQPRSAAALEAILGDYFEMAVEVNQFFGQWLYLDADDQSSLPCARWPRGLNASLGADVVIGERVWDVANKFRVRFGPLRYEEFRRFIPAGDALRPLCQMIRSYVGHPLDFDVQPILDGSEVPYCRLGGDDADPARLGWNTWIRSGPFDRDVSDAVFSLEGNPWTTSA